MIAPTGLQRSTACALGTHHMYTVAMHHMYTMAMHHMYRCLSVVSATQLMLCSTTRALRATGPTHLALQLDTCQVLLYCCLYCCLHRRTATCTAACACKSSSHTHTYQHTYRWPYTTPPPPPPTTHQHVATSSLPTTLYGTWLWEAQCLLLLLIQM